jgi:hypothetical protein
MQHQRFCSITKLRIEIAKEVTKLFKICCSELASLNEHSLHQLKEAVSFSEGRNSNAPTLKVLLLKETIHNVNL